MMLLNSMGLFQGITGRIKEEGTGYGIALSIYMGFIDVRQRYDEIASALIQINEKSR